jgi:hypothetical protein
MLELTSEEVAHAEACGVSFPAATPAQVQRYAMQRKVFRVAGEAVLATRDGALFETAATLARLIAEGERQRRDLASWRAATAPVRGAKRPPPPPPPAAARPSPPTAAPPGPPPVVRRAGGSRRIPAGERWLTAGAVRRGRLAQHWSARRGG